MKLTFRVKDDPREVKILSFKAHFIVLSRQSFTFGGLLCAFPVSNLLLSSCYRDSACTEQSAMSPPFICDVNVSRGLVGGREN